MTSRSSSSTSAIARRSNWRSSRTSSAPISTRSKKRNGYAQLGADYKYSHADIARIVGKSRSHVANTLRLTGLPEHSRALLAAGKITAGHARALLALADPDAVADRIVARGLSVRDVERLAERAGQFAAPAAAQAGRAGRRRHARA